MFSVFSFSLVLRFLRSFQTQRKHSFTKLEWLSFNTESSVTQAALEFLILLPLLSTGITGVCTVTEFPALLLIFFLWNRISIYIPLAVPELTLETRLASNSQRYACLCFLSDGIKLAFIITIHARLCAWQRHARADIWRSEDECIVFVIPSTFSWTLNSNGWLYSNHFTDWTVSTALSLLLIGRQVLTKLPLLT